MANEPTLPIPISAVGDKYLIFDIETVTWLRRVHHLCGVFIGTLPQNPAQNVFLGLPVEIMPEEAQLLVEKGVAYIIDDIHAHDTAMRSTDIARRNDCLNKLRQDAEEISTTRAKEREIEKAEKMKRGKAKQKAKNAKLQNDDQSQSPVVNDASMTDSVNIDESSSLFDSTSTIRPQSSVTDSTILTTSTASEPVHLIDHCITPTTSTSLIPLPAASSTTLQQPQIHNLPTSYPLYRHLHSLDYFMTPGLRFGANYCVYPGDPLRFHSHFLAVGVDWEEEIDLMDIVGGGRLGTGVKKGWLFGGEEPIGNTKDAPGTKAKVRTFSVEWAGM